MKIESQVKWRKRLFTKQKCLFSTADQDHPYRTKQLGDQKDHLGVVRSSGAAKTQHKRKTQKRPAA